MKHSAIAVLTYKSREHILSVGGTCSWALNRANARKIEFAVCTRNANTRIAEGPEPHATGFLVGRISDIVVSPEDPDRRLIQFSEYAAINQPGVWGHGWRNPVRYTTMEELGINADALDWHSMPDETPTDALLEPKAVAKDSVLAEDAAGQPRRLTIAEAKAGLAATFGVGTDAVEITIRG